MGWGLDARETTGLIPESSNENKIVTRLPGVTSARGGLFGRIEKGNRGNVSINTGCDVSPLRGESRMARTWAAKQLIKELGLSSMT